MYGVVVCSRCERARAVNLSQKTSTCECGSKIPIQRSKTYFKSDSQREAAEAVRQMNARLSGAPAPGFEGDVRAPQRKEDLESALSGLFGNEVRTRRQLRALLAKLGVGDSDRVIDELLATGVLFEPEKNHFRLV
ncbi:MAG: DUF1922 domain-containing protein [Thermoplasmata archaeon]|nr:DUF1922 domain-containing protein [Thermoplasmata archaeon]